MRFGGIIGFVCKFSFGLFSHQITVFLVIMAMIIINHISSINKPCEPRYRTKRTTVVAVTKYSNLSQSGPATPR